MYKAAGCRLGILERLGLIDFCYRDRFQGDVERRWLLTGLGSRLLDAHEAAMVSS